ncbi:MAG: hypothetical protein FWE21_01785 [Defluviitaleaceae bacterium]|nr:hypothetical protein [Defluviitaleaceae bacterium]
MSEKAIERASQLINSKAGYANGGMEFATLSLIDESGYPSATTFTIAQADGINWMTFGTGLVGRPYAGRIAKNNRACVCINAKGYAINLVGTIEALTDSKAKEDFWIEDTAMENHWSGPDDPQLLVLRFATQRYTIFFVDNGDYAAGELAPAKTNPSIEPMLQFNGNCEQAIEMYKKAFDAKVAVFMRYSDANPKDYPAIADEQKSLIYHAQLMIGSQRILLCDNLFNNLPRGHSVYPVVCFNTTEEAQAAFDILSEEAKILAPPSAATYSPFVTTFIDKFDIHWDLMVY